MDSTKIDILLKFALAAAGEEDFDNRQLGPIHLIKYVYLADLAYARYHNGQTFTGVQWKFHHFGPWAQEVYQRIDPVVLETGALEKRYSHPRYEDDFVRYTLSDESLYMRLERELPFVIVSEIKRGIRKFGADTQGLLDYVYKTEPMLKAAPEELLSFEGLSEEKLPIDDSAGSEEILSAKAKKKRKQKIEALRKKFKERLTQKRASKKLVTPPTSPRYDEVFFEGTKWLDSLVGAPVKEESGLLAISEDFWKSPARFDPDVS
ncbi:hypothetical protein [Desulfovulcanus sp.]